MAFVKTGDSQSLGQVQIKEATTVPAQPVTPEPKKPAQANEETQNGVH